MRVKSTHLLIAAAVIFFSSCTSDYTQVAYIGTTNDNVKKQSNFWVYENDSIQVVYSFWGPRGIMSFRIFNKCRVPMYVDWKKSSMISESKKRAYYSNKQITTYSGRSNTSSTAWVNIFKNYVYGNGSSSTEFSGEQLIVKPERVTFIPPQSYVFQGFDNLVDDIYFDIHDRNTERTTLDGIKVYVTTTHSGNKIVFRNFLTYATDEDFNTEKYVDNEFYVKKVVTMKDEDFNGAMLPGDGVHYEYPFMSPSRFYIDDLSEEITLYNQNKQ